MISLSGKIRTDTIYNILSFTFLGISGLLINIILAFFYTPEILGAFNLYYAIYIFLSQIVGAGIHFSVLKNTTQYEETNVENDILLNGLIATTINALFWLSIVYVIKDIFSIFFQTEEYANDVVLLLPALFLFVLNKVLLSYTNAKKKMLFFAIVNALRPIFMLLYLIMVIVASVNTRYIVLMFVFAESLLFLILFFRYIKSIFVGSVSYEWIREHIIHGYKSAIGSVLIDVNTKVDVLMLGYFTNEKLVGIYSIASIIVEGFLQLSIVFRNIVNPYLTKFYFFDEKEKLISKIKEGRNLAYKFLVPVGVMIILIYPFALKAFGFYAEYERSILPLNILIAGTLLSVGYAPFLMIFNQAGKPGIQSLLYFLIFATNLLLNLILIPLIGIAGAAVATSCANASLLIYMKLLSKGYLGMKI